MSLQQLVNEECAEYSGGRCRDAGPCHVLAGQRCNYFEEVVAPVVHWPDPVGEMGLRRRQSRDWDYYRENNK